MKIDVVRFRIYDIKCLFKGDMRSMWSEYIMIEDSIAAGPDLKSGDALGLLVTVGYESFCRCDNNGFLGLCSNELSVKSFGLQRCPELRSPRLTSCGSKRQWQTGRVKRTVDGSTSSPSGCAISTVEFVRCGNR
jgi:hypothetical protein